MQEFATRVCKKRACAVLGRSADSCAESVSVPQGQSVRIVYALGRDSQPTAACAQQGINVELMSRIYTERARQSTVHQRNGGQQSVRARVGRDSYSCKS
eukprot:1159328-Pelagomonas_calceolata.AAC.2